MHLQARARPYTCLSCLIKSGRTATGRLGTQSSAYRQRLSLSSSPTSRREFDGGSNQPLLINLEPSTFSSGFSQTVQSNRPQNSSERNGTPVRPVSQDVTSKPGHRYRKSTNIIQPSQGERTQPRTRHINTSASAAVKLSQSQQEELKAVQSLTHRLSQGLNSLPDSEKDSSVLEGISIEDVLKAVSTEGQSPVQQRLIDRIGTSYTGKSFGQVKQDLDLATSHHYTEHSNVTDPDTQAAMVRLGVLEHISDAASSSAFMPFAEGAEETQDPSSVQSASRGKQRRPLAPFVAPPPSAPKKASLKNPKLELKQSSFPFRKANYLSVDAADLVLETVEVEGDMKLPQLSFDLSRVLFNPGVYQLQDPRSRVYNFDPYLEQLLPISEFNYDALNPYLTSSEDTQLLQIAQKSAKKYIGSSSSMTSALSQFHFLISQWRELNMDNLSRGFQDNGRAFTQISRSPAAIFLRYRDGVYAVDADKELDEPNVLMSLGKSMEKLLTVEKDEFEKWKKSYAGKDKEAVKSEPEAFHYSQQGRFLLRSQLDVYDPRLPGKGYFDLKTRAVAGVRMNIRDHETGMGYQIKERYGTWESYEREYYDMMRSTLLKYSLQARMGSMDGIFVAYHNISRMFGFQYIPMSEMDVALHGQSDPILGDQEFRFSLNFMEEVFNMGTETYPSQSLRIHFDTRDATVSEPRPFMNIFIEPMTESSIQAIQDTQKAQLDVFERKLLRGEDPDPSVLDGEAQQAPEDIREEVTSQQTTEEVQEANPENLTSTTAENQDEPLPPNTIYTTASGPGIHAANRELLNKIVNLPMARTKPKLEGREIMGLRLTIQNNINGRPVARPESISAAAKWSIDYQLQRIGDDEAKKAYTFCKNRRISYLKTAINKDSNNYFLQSIKQLSEKGARWRQKQDELDAQRDRVVLYESQQ